MGEVKYDPCDHCEYKKCENCSFFRIYKKYCEYFEKSQEIRNELLEITQKKFRELEF